MIVTNSASREAQFFERDAQGLSPINRATYDLGFFLISNWLRFALDLDLQMHAPLPEGPRILAANHPTTTDPFYLIALSPEHMSILITEMAFKAPVFGDLLRMSGHIRVNLEGGRPAFEAGLEALRLGRTVGIFPEGGLSPQSTRSSGPRSGVARLAMLSGAPVIPVGIAVDPARIWYRETSCGDMVDTARWYTSGPYIMTVGEAMRLSGPVSDYELVRANAEQVMGRVRALSAESESRLPPRPAPLAGLPVSSEA